MSRHHDGSNQLKSLPAQLRESILAAHDKKASEVLVLDLRNCAAFTDFFLICSGQHSRQVKAIADNITDRLRHSGVKPAVVEGTERAEWILIDFFDFVVHVFTPETRSFYALEGLWGSAQRVEVDANPA